MSLRAFHIVFITVITLFCSAVALWFLVIKASASSAMNVAGICCAVVAVLAPLYGAYFYKKIKTLSL